MFTRQHYEAIAEVLRTERPCTIDPKNIRYRHHQRIEGALAWLFERDNPQFNRDRFLSACKPQYD